MVKDGSSFKFLAYSDSSYANLKNAGSQVGFIIFPTDADGVKLSPIAWQSKRIKHVVKSTLVAEMLALVDAAEASFSSKVSQTKFLAPPIIILTV